MDDAGAQVDAGEPDDLHNVLLEERLAAADIEHVDVPQGSEDLFDLLQGQLRLPLCGIVSVDPPDAAGFAA